MLRAPGLPFRIPGVQIDAANPRATRIDLMIHTLGVLTTNWIKGMKIQGFAALTIGTMIALGAQAQTQGGSYGGLFVNRMTYKADGLSNAYPLTIGAKLGTEFNRNFAVEARVGAGVA